MKKITPHSILYIITITLFTVCLTTLPPYFFNLQASTIEQDNAYSKFKEQTAALLLQFEALNSSLNTYEKSLNELDKRLSDVEEQNVALNNLLVNYYIEKLHDPTYVSIDSEQHTYYLAAEALGHLGKPAIPALINQLDTDDDYERALVLYALMLASQADNVACFCGNDYMHLHLDFDARNHTEAVAAARTWWEKYKSHFN